MRSKLAHRACACLSLIVLSACSSAVGPPASLLLSTSPDFSARVSQIEFEGGNGPAGPYSQYDAWVVVAPSVSANAGVVIPTKVPVFARHNGQIFSSNAKNIKVGDMIEVWHDFTVGYGAVQGPPGAPTYGSTQIVIDQ
jgi:hypothetical protein